MKLWNRSIVCAIKAVFLSRFLSFFFFFNPVFSNKHLSCSKLRTSQLKAIVWAASKEAAPCNPCRIPEHSGNDPAQDAGCVVSNKFFVSDPEIACHFPVSETLQQVK